MKNKIIILISIGLVLAVIGGAIIMLFNSNKQPDVGEFELNKYRWEIETFPSDKNVGQVDDANAAIEKAKELWIEKYSVVGGQPNNPINGKPIKIYFDEKNDCWYVHGTLPKNQVGGYPHAIIQKDGKVIAVWHDD